MNKFFEFQEKIFFCFPFYFMFVSDLIFNLLFGWLRFLYRNYLSNKKFVKLAFEFQRVVHQNALLIVFLIFGFAIFGILPVVSLLPRDVECIINFLLIPILVFSMLVTLVMHSVFENPEAFLDFSDMETFLKRHDGYFKVDKMLSVIVLKQVKLHFDYDS